MKTLLSLFDYSGTWSKPFFDNGWNVIQWDIKHSELMDINLLKSAEMVLEMFEDVNGILAAAPCTHFANSGARWFAQKDKDGRTQQNIDLVYQVMRLADLFAPTDPDYDGVFFWSLENPVGRIGRLTGLQDPVYFDPWEFAGYVNATSQDIELLDRIRLKDGDNITAEEAQFIIDKNCYTKKTGLWGEFNRNMIKKPIPPVKGSKWGTPMMRLGGKSDKTKEIRSITPEGFAEAFYQANHNHIYNDDNVLIG